MFHCFLCGPIHRSDKYFLFHQIVHCKVFIFTISDYCKCINFCHSEMLSAPVKRIDEILALPHSPDEFSGQEVPPSDDDSWLYNGEDELNSALLERQKEMDLYNSKHKKKQNGQDDTGPSSSSNVDEVGLGDIAKTMQDFVHKVSSYKGAEVPENRLAYLCMCVCIYVVYLCIHLIHS